jgi:hypothetical protein
MLPSLFIWRIMKVEAFIEKYRQSVTPVGEVFDVVCLFDCTELTHNLAKKHFASIAESPELFMLHYIKHAVGIISPDEEPCYKLEIRSFIKSNVSL